MSDTRISQDRITRIESTDYCGDHNATMVFIRTHGDHHSRICSGCPATLTPEWLDIFRPDERYSQDQIRFIRSSPTICDEPNATYVSIYVGDGTWGNLYRYVGICSVCGVNPSLTH